MLGFEFVILAASVEERFKPYRTGLAEFFQILLGFVALFSAAMVVVNVLQGERESLKKILVWLGVSVLGYVVLGVLS